MNIRDKENVKIILNNVLDQLAILRSIVDGNSDNELICNDISFIGQIVRCDIKKHIDNSDGNDIKIQPVDYHIG